MLGPCIVMVSTPFSVGYAVATVREKTHGRIAVAALVIALLEATTLVWLLLQATT